MTTTLKVGNVVYGFAGGVFGRDNYEDKIVVDSGMQSGVQWLLLKEIYRPTKLHFICGDELAGLEEFLTPA